MVTIKSNNTLKEALLSLQPKMVGDAKKFVNDLTEKPLSKFEDKDGFEILGLYSTYLSDDKLGCYFLLPNEQGIIFSVCSVDISHAVFNDTTSYKNIIHLFCPKAPGLYITDTARCFFPSYLETDVIKNRYCSTKVRATMKKLSMVANDIKKLKKELSMMGNDIKKLRKELE